MPTYVATPAGQGPWPGVVVLHDSPMGYRAARLERPSPLTGSHDVKVYPEASHGLLNNHPPEDMTPLMVLLSKVSGRAA